MTVQGVVSSPMKVPSSRRRMGSRRQMLREEGTLNAEYINIEPQLNGAALPLPVSLSNLYQEHLDLRHLAQTSDPPPPPSPPDEAVTPFPPIPHPPHPLPPSPPALPPRPLSPPPPPSPSPTPPHSPLPPDPPQIPPTPSPPPFPPFRPPQPPQNPPLTPSPPSLSPPIHPFALPPPLSPPLFQPPVQSTPSPLSAPPSPSFPAASGNSVIVTFRIQGLSGARRRLQEDFADSSSIAQELLQDWGGGDPGTSGSSVKASVAATPSPPSSSSPPVMGAAQVSQNIAVGSAGGNSSALFQVIRKLAMNLLMDSYAIINNKTIITTLSSVCPLA